MKQPKKATTKHKVYGATTVEHMTSRPGGLTVNTSREPRKTVQLSMEPASKRWHFLGLILSFARRNAVM